MSEAPLDREWQFYVEDMLAFCEKAMLYARDADRATFVSDRMRYDAVLRNLELIGEAATHVPQQRRESAADVPWAEGHRGAESACARLSRD